ncbi:MAG TPA: GNAT family N-acetyltransferase, partial [Thermoflexales bacterium]|nr:GNAT family N-acetyltransferase [Thermoflexales bacterium]
ADTGSFLKRYSPAEPGNIASGTDWVMGFEIREATTEADVEAVRALLRDYMAEQGLTPGSSPRAYEDLKDLPGRYARPSGRLLLALQDGQPAGCGGLTDVPGPDGPIPGWTEMKRVYLAPGFRGLGRGRALAQALLGQAREAGYTRVVLSTRIRWREAHAMYHSLGFREIAPFKHKPEDMGDLQFMALDLA